jgi:hypothetical protein
MPFTGSKNCSMVFVSMKPFFLSALKIEVDSSTFSCECVEWKLSKLTLKRARSRLCVSPTRATSSSGVMPSDSARSMIGAPCESSAQTKLILCPWSRWKRTQMSAWVYSMMWPRWNGAFA